jgi:hypothetical protein
MFVLLLVNVLLFCISEVILILLLRNCLDLKHTVTKKAKMEFMKVQFR